MSFALSQRRTDRHPVGLAIVVGLHVVLAALLLSARLKPGAPEAPFAPVQPIDEPPRPVQPRPVDLPQPPHVLPRNIVTLPSEIRPDPQADAIVARTEDEPATPPSTQVAAVGPDDNRILDAARMQPRAARIDAGAAQCRPAYPPAAQRSGATGTTRIRFTVDAGGRIAGSQIVHASGATREHRLMDQSAAAALAQCPLQVGTDETGRPTGTTTDVEYVWTLN